MDGGPAQHRLLNDGVQHFDRTLAGPVCPVHAHDTGIARQHPGGASDRLGLVRTEISGWHDVAWEAPGGGRLRDGQTALNWLVDNYPGLAECLSSVNESGSLLVALDKLDFDAGFRVNILLQLLWRGMQK